MVEVSAIKIYTRANTKTLIIKVITTKVITISTTTHIEATIKAIVTTTSGVEAVGEPEVITMAMPAAGSIIKVIIITNQSNMAHRVLYVVHSLKHCFEGEHDKNNIVEKMNMKSPIKTIKD